jgi:chromosome partitioning protein
VTSPAAEETSVVSRETDEKDATDESVGDPSPELPATTPASEPESTDAVAHARVIRTAGDFAGVSALLDDETTPLARMAEDTIRARQEAAQRPPMPRPEATRILVVANQKGGVGKTTTTVNVAAALAQLGQRVLVIDLDPQGNASTALGVDHQRGVPSTYDALVDGEELAGLSSPVPDLPRLDVVPATIDLAGAEIELVSMVARENRLRRAITGHARVGTAEEAGEERYDYVFVDCPPSLGLLTLNALVAGDEMLIPIQAEYYALEGLGQLLETVEMVKAHLNPRLVVSTIMVTMYDGRTRLASGVAQEVREHFGDQVLRTAIPRSVRVSEAPSYGQTVMTYDPASPGALSYLEAAREMARKGAPR